MNASKISVRYGKAVFMLAKENNVLKEVYKDFGLIYNTLVPYPEFATFFSSPVITPEDKIKLFEETFKKYVSDLTLNFLIFVVNKNRETHLIDIMRYYEFLYRREYHIKEVIVTTPDPISEEVKNKISNKVSEVYNSSVEITNIINENMIGGVIIRIDNQQLDLSVKTQLEEIKKSLKSEVYQIGL